MVNRTYYIFQKIVVSNVVKKKTVKMRIGLYHYLSQKTF